MSSSTLRLSLVATIVLLLLATARCDISFTSPDSVIYGTPALSSLTLSSDGSSFLFALDRFSNRGLCIDIATGAVVTSFVASSPSLDYPYAIAQDQLTGNVWIADSTSRLVQFDRNGLQLTSWQLTAVPGSLLPYALATDRLGFLYVALSPYLLSQGPLTVLKLSTASGALVATWNSSSVLNGIKTLLPSLLSVVGDGSLYMFAYDSASVGPALISIDTVLGNVTAVYALPWPINNEALQGGCIDAHASSLYTSYSYTLDQPARSYIFRTLIGSDSYVRPVKISSAAIADSAIAIDSSGSLYLTSKLQTNVIAQTNGSGSVTATYTVLPRDPNSTGAFVRPSYIAVDSHSNLYAAFASLYSSSYLFSSWRLQLIARVSPQGQPAGVINTTSSALALGMVIDSRDRLITLTQETLRSNISVYIRSDGIIRVFGALNGSLLATVNLTVALPFLNSSTTFSALAIDAADCIYVSTYDYRWPSDNIYQLDGSSFAVLAVIAIATHQSELGIDRARGLLYTQVFNYFSISSFTGVRVYNLSTSQLIAQVDSAYGVYLSSSCLMLDAEGRVYVADRPQGAGPRVLVFQLSDGALQAVGNYTAYNALSASYRALALDKAGQRLYVADAGGVLTFPSYASALLSDASSSSSSSGSVAPPSAASSSPSTASPASSSSSTAVPLPSSSSAATSSIRSSRSSSSSAPPSSSASGRADTGVTASSTSAFAASSSPAPPPSSSSSTGSLPVSDSSSSSDSVPLAAVIPPIVLVLVLAAVVAAVLLAWRSGWSLPCSSCCVARGDKAGKVIADDRGLLHYRASSSETSSNTFGGMEMSSMRRW